MRDLQDDRVLPCLHSFCLTCLTLLINKGSFSLFLSFPFLSFSFPFLLFSSFFPPLFLTFPFLSFPSFLILKYADESPLHKCPLCRSEFTTPEQGIGSLPRFYFTSNLLSNQSGLEKILANPNEIKCDWCDPENLGDATSYCLTCKEFCCAECLQIHKRQKVSREHQYISVDEGWKLISGSGSGSGSDSDSPHHHNHSHQGEKIPIRSSHCLEHPNQEIDTFCEKDQELICLKCFVQFHNGHTFAPLKNMISQFKAEIEPKLAEV